MYSLSRSPQNKYASTVVYVIDFMRRRGELNLKNKIFNMHTNYVLTTNEKKKLEFTIIKGRGW